MPFLPTGAAATAMRAAAAICLGLAPALATAATPVTFTYDSGTFSSPAYAGSPGFGSHIVASFSYSDDFDYSIRPLQHLSNTATLLDWSVTSGIYTLDASNATLTIDITDYFSTFFTVPLVQFNFQAAANIGGFPFSITGRPGLNITQGLGVNPAIRCGLYNQICGTNYRSFNLGSGSYTKGFYTGGGGGVGGGGVGSVTEPASWALLMVGFGIAGTAMRRRRDTVASVAA